MKYLFSILILLSVLGIPIRADAQTPTTATLLASFSVEPDSDRQVTVTGKIDTTIQQVDGVTVTFYYSRSQFTGTTNPSDARQEKTGDKGQPAIATDGTYVLKIADLSPKTTYYFKQVTSKQDTILDTKPGTFDTKDGFVAPGSNKEQELFDAKSYRLLAPWPGLSVLMDPDLCRQQKDAKVLPEDAICDINGFLNFAFKLLIGLTAVVLVLRLMFEGYQYVVTDIPFLKASAKGNFFTALLGLLLALSAYLILNTINPKLVNNTITIDSVAVGVEEQLALEQAGYDAVSAKNLSPEDIKRIVISYQGKYKYIQDEYIPARDAALPSASKGIKVLITAHSAFEGFYPGSKSYRTRNPGNIGNTDSGATVTYATLGEGVKKQHDHISGIVNGTNRNYKIGQTYPSIGGVYDGSLYQYLKIYATGARQSNTYLSYIISYFKKEGYTITGYTKMSEIAAMR